MNGKAKWVGVSWMVAALLPLVAGMAVAANTSSTRPPINTESPVARADIQPSQSHGPLSYEVLRAWKWKPDGGLSLEILIPACATQDPTPPEPEPQAAATAAPVDEQTPPASAPPVVPMPRPARSPARSAPPLEHNSFSRLGFQVLDGWGVRQRDGSPVVMGEVKNIGSIAQGVTLQVIQRDVAGRVVYEKEFLPAGLRNIAPGEARAFTRDLSEDPTAATVELRIVETIRFPS
jgi:hypothetical protein